MTVTKEEFLEMVRQLPDEIDIEDHLPCTVRERLEQAEAGIAAGRTCPTEEIRAWVAGWGSKDEIDMQG